MYKVRTLERRVRDGGSLLQHNLTAEANDVVPLAKFSVGIYLVADRKLGVERADFQKHRLIPIAQPDQIQQHLLVVRLPQYHVVVGAGATDEFWADGRTARKQRTDHQQR